MPFQDGSYDSVICSEVLEHVPAPEESIKELIRVLKPGGVLALSVPRFLPEWICWQLSEGYQQISRCEGTLVLHLRRNRAEEIHRRTAL